jgi:hypothetical protein
VSLTIKFEKVPLRILLALAAAWIAPAQIPRFEDYPVTEVFNGTPAAPILATPQERLYRTRIREGVSKGAGVIREGIERPGPNFAGHYIVIEWYCGSPCAMNAMVDAITGKIYGPPISEGLALPVIAPGDPDPSPQWGPATVEFRLNSRLMIIDANPNFPNDKINYRHYLLWENNRWKLLRRVPLAPCQASNKPPNPAH